MNNDLSRPGEGFSLAVIPVKTESSGLFQNRILDPRVRGDDGTGPYLYLSQ